MTAERGPRSENIPVHHGQGELRVRTYFPYSAVSVEYITTGRDANLGAALSFDLTFREVKALRKALKIHLDRSKHDDLDG